MAEALMSVLSKGRIKAFNAPILPVNWVHPLAEELISAIGYRKDETLEPLNIFDQLRGKQADYIFVFPESRLSFALIIGRAAHFTSNTSTMRNCTSSRRCGIT